MQTTSAAFTSHAEGQVRPLSWAFRVSFDKAFDDTVDLFTLDTSVLDGQDVLAPSEDNPLQQWDFYEYQNYTDRVVSMDWSREIEFPSSVTIAMADVELNNYDDYFTPDSTSPIEQYIIPKRPIRIFAGFGGENIQQFVGLTEKMPVVRDDIKKASFHAIDFLSQMFNMPIDQTIAMENVRTDEVLAELFQQFGMSPTQYSLEKGSNIIPFLFYDRGVKAGEVFRKLMEAEAGNLWLDEQGIIRFSQRVELEQSSVYSFTDENTVDISTSRDDNIINKVVINADIREVQEFQTVFIKSLSDDAFVVPAGGSKDYEVALSDPLKSASVPSVGSQIGSSWFTALEPNGDEITTDIEVTDIELRTNTYVITFTNTNSFAVTIDQLEVWGEPARVIDMIEYSEVNQASIDKYEEKVLEINNNFIQSVSQADSLALMILDQFSEYANTIEISVKGNFALQLGDIITVDVKTYSGTYKISKITNKLIEGQYTQIIKARKYTPRSWFVLDQSVLDGSDLLTP